VRDRVMGRWSTYEPFYVELSGKKVADIVVTNHAKKRWANRISGVEHSAEYICDYIWKRLKEKRIRPYYRNSIDVFVVDEDLVMVAEFALLDEATDISGNPLHKMIIVTFLGCMSETIELRDLKTYYSWLRHSRRMTLIKNSRKRK